MFYDNAIEEKEIFSIGSVVYLVDPSEILIQNSTFLANLGNSGTCIYYSESHDQHFLKLNDNLFINNEAKFCGAGVYLNNHYEQLFPYENNFFQNNVAPCSPNYTTSPFRLQPKTKTTSKKVKNTKIQMKIVPGITLVFLEFIFLDYFGQPLNILDDGMANIELRNYDNFSINIDPSLSIDGKLRVPIINGI